MGNIIHNIKKFYEETLSELSKCSWPPKHELINSTVLVIVTLLILVVWIAVVDKGASELVRWLTNL